MRNKFKLVSFLVLFIAFFVVTNEVKAVCVVLFPNGVLELDKECDDGNLIETDSCDNNCEVIVSTCGNGTVEGEEDCDDGNLLNGDGCNSLCESEGVCGNGIEENGEACDDVIW